MTDQEKRKKEFTDIYKNRQKQKKLTPEKYMDLKADGQSDAKIMKAYGFHVNKFNAWKHEHNLIGKHGPVNSQRFVQQPKGENTMNDTKESQNAPTDVYKVKYEAMKEQNIKHVEESKSVQTTIDNLKREVDKLTARNSELEESLAASTQTFTATDAQEEIWKLSQEIERLKKYESDYRNLEVDFRNLHTENERMKRMLDRLKHTERMNLWMMEQYVGLHKQVDEVLA